MAITSSLQRRIGGRHGLTLTEVMIALMILTFGIVAFMGSFAGMSRSIRVSKARTLATNLAQEEVESLKNLSYYRLLVTTATAVSAEPGLGGFLYDNGAYKPETLTVGQIAFERRVLIRKVAESGGVITPTAWSDADTGLKEITAYVIWREGEEYRKVQITNLRDNPNRPVADARFQGKVRANGVPLAGVNVYTLQNQLYSNITDATGDYSFKLPAGTYNLFAQKRGYFPGTVQSTVTASGATTVDFTLAEKGVGSIQGFAYIADRVVISEIAAAVDGNEVVEYVELYNPMSTPVSMYTTHAAYQVEFSDILGNRRTISPPSEVLYVRTQIPANGYFLIASSPVVKGVLADAYYFAGGVPIHLNKIPTLTSGGVKLVSMGVNESTGTVIDAIGWGRNGGLPLGPVGFREGDGLKLQGGFGFDGFSPEETIERVAYSSSTHVLMDKLPATGAHQLNGNGYDTDDNFYDWIHHNHTDNERPQNSLMTETAGAATPAAGATIFADDGVSGSATALSIPIVGSFTVTNVATGTWNVVVSSRGYVLEKTGIVVGLGAQTSLGSVIIDQIATTGFLSGRVLSGGAPLQLITVETSNGEVDYTNSLGEYRFQVIPGTHVVTANPDNLNTSYTADESTGVYVGPGEAKVIADLNLAQGGTVNGFVSSNGTDPLPYIPIIATNTSTGIEIGTALSDAYGRFTFPNLQVGTYTLTPELEAGESANPSVMSATVTVGSNIFAGTMTVTNAFGTISGTVLSGGQPVTTGALIIAVAQPNTISGAYPPTNNQTLRNGSVAYYIGSSNSDGTYAVPVRGGATYNVYAWYTSFNGTTPTVTKRSGTALINAGATGTVNFSW